MTEDRVPMTREGYDKKKSELDRLQTTEMIEITKRVATARDLGDLSENAEYHAAREDQAILQARIDQLRDQLSRAEIIDTDQLSTDTIAFGSRVRVKDLDLDEEEIYEIVGPGQDDPDHNRILTTSPIAQGLLGKKAGEVAEIPVPSGVLHMKVLEISHAEMD